MRTAIMRILTLLCMALWLTACTEDSKPQVNTDPVAFHAGDECHVCGMLILEWPGAKGQSINQQNGETHKFCSTVDMFAWWLQPENKTLQAQIYVHDMSKTHWEQPEDEHLMDARKAWYVIGSDLHGAMGPSLASFADRADAERLAQEHDGRVLGFEQIDLEVLQEIARAGHEHAAAHGEMMQQMHAAGHDDSMEEQAAHGQEYDLHEDDQEQHEPDGHEAH